MTPVIAAERRQENVLDIMGDIMEREFFNKRTGYKVDHDDILEYLSDFPNNSLIKDRVDHFELWLQLEPMAWFIDASGHQNGQYWQDGKLHNPDRTPVLD